MMYFILKLKIFPSSVCLLQRPKNNGQLNSNDTLSAHVTVLIYHFPLKEIRLLEQVLILGLGQNIIQGKPEKAC